MAAADFDWLVLETVLRVVDLADIATTILKRSACSAASEVAQCIGTLTSIRAPIETFAQVICDRRTMQEVAVRTSDLPACTHIARLLFAAQKQFPCCHIFHSFCHDSSATVVSHDLNLKQARTAKLISKVVLNLKPLTEIHNAASQK